MVRVEANVALLQFLVGDGKLGCYYNQESRHREIDQ
jgi:hypothetical protein